MNKKIQNTVEKNEEELRISSLYNRLIITSIITLTLIFGLIFYIYPKIQEVSANKVTLLGKIDIYEKYNINGLTYDEFSSLGEEGVKKMLGKDGADFFANNLINNESVNNEKISYMKFLDTKEVQINEKNKSNEITLRDEKISKILPSYTEGVQVEGNLTDLGFVNYIESLLRTFQLKTNAEIGISNLVEVENKNQKESSLSTKIFYVPLKFNLIGRKADIIDFLNFAENVGVVLDIEKMQFYKDNYITKTMAGQLKTSDYNIYENKLMDISDIKFPKYIDTSSSLRSTSEYSKDGFISFIKNGFEKNDEFSIDVSLNFYVKGLPTYKIELFAESVVKKYKDMSAQVKDLSVKAKNRNTINLNKNIVQIISTLKTLDLYLSELEPKIKSLEGLKGDLNKVYKTASDINYDLGNLEKYISVIKIEDEKK